MATTSEPEKRLRADAERNRQRILAAAATLYAERGLEISLDEIAAAAGVGVGTVYRRFPDKEALIDAVFDSRVEEVATVARAAIALEDPWEAFSTFMWEVCRLQARDRGLKEALLSADRGAERVKRGRATMAPLGRQVLQRAQEAGVVRADLAHFDVPLIHLTIGMLADRTRDVAPDYWERMLTVMLDGLRPQTGTATPLTAAPLDLEEFTAVLARRR